MRNKAQISFQQFLINSLLSPASQKINSKAFMHDAFEILLQDKKFSKSVLKEIYHKALKTAHDPMLMKKLLGRPGADHAVSRHGNRSQENNN